MTAVTGAASTAATTEGKPEGLLVDLRGAAAMLEMSERQLQYLVEKRAVRSIKIGPKMRRFAVADLRRWIEAGCPTERGAADLIGGGQ